MSKTAVFGGDDDEHYKEPLAPIFQDVMFAADVEPYNAEGSPQAKIEYVQRQDLTEDILTKLDVSGWPEVRYWNARIIRNDGTVTPPKYRVQRIFRANGEIVYALWTPIPRNLEDLPVVEVIRLTGNGDIPVAGWRITYHHWDGHWCECSQATYINTPVGLHHPECGRLRQPRGTPGKVNIGAMQDDDYNGFFPTIRGTDPAHWDPNKKGMDAWRGGPVMYGQPDENGRRYPVTGREISGGRREYREATANYYHYDSGFFRDIDRTRAEAQERRDENFALDQERADKQLPRKLGEI